jgi:hypothetical protein
MIPDINLGKKVLLFITGEKAWDTHKTITTESGVKQRTLEVVSEKSDDYFEPRINIIYECLYVLLLCTTGR